jgi:hypothetical protein
MSDADARLWHPWLRISRVLRAEESDPASGMLHPDGAGTRGRRTVNVLPFRGPSLDASTVPS